jgi:hypothetical protein
MDMSHLRQITKPGLTSVLIEPELVNGRRDVWDRGGWMDTRIPPRNGTIKTGLLCTRSHSNEIFDPVRINRRTYMQRSLVGSRDST